MNIGLAASGTAMALSSVVLAGCGETPTTPLPTTKPALQASLTSSDNRVWGTAPAMATSAGVQICHRTVGTRPYIMIEVAPAAVRAHRAHGDAAVGEPVPGAQSMVFDPSCEPVPIRLKFSFADPLADHLQFTPTRQLNPPAGVIDLVGLDFTFNATTGDYQILLTASGVNPFVGGFRINVHLFNPDVGTTAQDPAFFVDSLEGFLTTPTTTLTLTGTNPRLLAWEVGDRVAPCQGTSFEELGPCLGGLGLPDGVTAFSTGVYTFTSPPPFGLPKGTDVFYSANPASVGAAGGQ